MLDRYFHIKCEFVPMDFLFMFTSEIFIKSRLSIAGDPPKDRRWEATIPNPITIKNFTINF